MFQISIDPKDNINYVDAYGIVKFTDWTLVGGKMKTGTIPHHDDSETILVGNNAQSLLAQVDIAQHLRDYILLSAVGELYRTHYRQRLNLPYVLPFGQVHCGCCRWSYPYSSARATQASPIHDFEAYFMISDSYTLPPIPPSLWRCSILAFCLASSSFFPLPPFLPYFAPT